VVVQSVRSTYDGPVTLATDYMVFKVTRDDIRVRMAAVDQNIWPLPPTRPRVVKKERLQEYGEFTASGRVMMRDVLEQVWSEVNEKYGTDAKLPPPRPATDGGFQGRRIAGGG
jgi:ribonuclease Z